MSSILYAFSRPPYGGINAQEGLDALLMGSAFTDCAVLLVGDGLLQLISGQSTDALGTKQFTLGYGALRDYGVTRIACAKADMIAHSLNADDFIVDVEVLDHAGMQKLINEYDRVLNF